MLRSFYQNRLPQIFEDRSATGDERAFADHAVKAKEERDSRLALTGSGFVWALAAGCAPFCAPEVRAATAAALLAIAGMFAAAYAAYRRGADVRATALVAEVASMAAALALARYSTSAIASPVRAAVGPFAWLVPATATLLYTPFAARLDRYLCGAVIAGGALAFGGAHPGLALLIALTSTLWTFAKTVLRVRMRHDAHAAYRARIALIPGAIARRSIGADGPGSLAFAPEDRDAICISTDLKAYDSVLSSPDLAALEPYLRAVYQRTELLLRRYFPAENFCVDWIGGELFIVVFAELGRLPDASASAALAFARALLRDAEGAGTASVGLSAGSAFVGMMGPKGNRKATALGEVAGRARRLQQSAWTVKDRTGGAPAVIFGADLYARLNAASRARIAGEVRLGDAQRLRDLDDRVLHFAVAAREAA